MKTRAILAVVLLALIFSCQKDEPNPPDTNDTPDIPPVTGIIPQPANPDDPAILPEVVTVIKKLDGDFTPLLTGVVANWKVESRKYYGSAIWGDCWSELVTTNYDGKTREGVKGQSITYQPCDFVYTVQTRIPDFSKSAASVWGQYQAGEPWIKDAYGIWNQEIEYTTYYSMDSLPDAYILMERRWEVVPIPGEGDYAYCEGCTSLTKTTSITTGLSVENTKDWGYTLGIEWNSGVNFQFASLGAKVSVQFNQQFSTSIQNYEETTSAITISGTMPEGKNIMRLQVFREISTFKLVNQDGGDYFPGIYSPVIEITTQTKNFVWYY